MMQPFAERVSAVPLRQKAPWKGSLRSRIIAWSFVPTAILLTSAALVSLYAYQRLTESLVLDRNRDMTILSAELLATELAAYTNPLSDQFLAVFDGVVAFSANGTIIAADWPEYTTARPTWLSQVIPSQASHSKPAFSNVVLAGPGGEKMVVAIIPGPGAESSVRGGLVGLFHLSPTTDSPLFRSLSKLRRGQSHSLYLVDAHGQVIWHSNPALIGENFAALSVVQQAIAGGTGALRTRSVQQPALPTTAAGGPEGERIVASYAAVPGTTWSLISEESWAALGTTSRRYSRFAYLLLGLGVVIPTAIVAFGVRRITHPIRELSQAAQRVSTGNFGQRISTSVGGELEELAEQFNLMAAQLQESYTHLEQKVADRTRELALLNTIAVEASRSLDLKEILSHALEQVMDVMGMDRGQAFRLDDETGELILVAHRGPSAFGPASGPYPARQSLNACLAGQAAAQGRPIYKRIAACPASEWKELMVKEGIQLVVSMPLLAKGRAVGMIDLQAQTPRAVTPEEASLLTAIGHQIGVAVENACLYEQAQQLATVRERSRLARDLHDSVTQSLYGVTLCAEAAARQLALGDNREAADQLRAIRSTTQEALREMRLLIFELRQPTLKKAGLAGALQARLEAVEQRAGLAADLKVEGAVQIAPEMEEGLYRLAQEALNNTLRHAGASRVVVSLVQRNRSLSLEIADDGCGFDPVAARQGGFGLSGMEERVARLGGTLTLDSQPGQGTRVRVEVHPCTI